MGTSNALSTHGRVLDSLNRAAGTCFQVDDGYLVTAHHVLTEVSADSIGAVVRCQPMEYQKSGGPVIEAEVCAFDEARDLAILRSGSSFPASVRCLASFDNQRPNTELTLTGFALDEPSFVQKSYSHATTTALWEGPRQDEVGLTLGRVRCDGAARGMSGCAIVRSSDGAVVGVLSGRFNSSNGWSAGRAIVTRSEDLHALFQESTNIALPIDRQAPKKAAVSLLREHILRDNDFLDEHLRVEVPGWKEAYEAGLSALQDGKIVVIVSPQGVGTTTFAQTLLRDAGQSCADMASLEPPVEWDRPDIGLLPLYARRAYLLELTDPGDEPSEQFVTQLDSRATDYRSMRSMLIVTVREDLWRAANFATTRNLLVVRINSSPDPVRLVQKRAVVSAEPLVSMLEHDSLKRHFQGLSAVQARRAFGKLVNAYRAAVGKDGDLLRRHLAEVLDDHLSELDRGFSETRPQGAIEESQIAPVLSLNERCVLFSLAFLQECRLDRLQELSTSLEDLLKRSGSAADPPRSVPLDQVFASAGFRGRLRNITAETLPGEKVKLPRAGFADAVIAYVWNNYDSLRTPLASWMISCIERDPAFRQRTVLCLDELIRSNQSFEFLRSDFRQLCVARGAFDLLAEVVERVVQDVHMRRRVERLLYEWARNSELRGLVIRVSLRMLNGERRGIALTRLQRATDSGGLEEAASADLLDGLRSLVRAEGVERAMESFRPWFSSEVSSEAAVLAFVALLEHEDFDSFVLNLSQNDDGYILRMLGRSLSSKKAIASLGAVAARASQDSSKYDNFVARLAYAAVTSNSIPPALVAVAEISDNGLTGSRDFVGDFVARFRALSPWGAESKDRVGFV